MYCIKCGAKIAEGSNFCNVCGEAVIADGTEEENISEAPETKTVAQDPMQSELSSKDTAETYSEQTVPAINLKKEPPEKKPKPPKTKHDKKPWSKKKKLAVFIPCAIVLALCIAAAVIIPVTLNRRYDEAVSIMNGGNPQMAKGEFLKLGNYKDSDEMVAQCQNMLDYDAASKKMDSGDYVSAKSGFLALGDYKDSGALAAECDKMINYLEAVGKMNRGDYTMAKSDFLALDGYKDSAALAEQCQKIMEYETAVVLMDMEEYALALESFIRVGDIYDSVSLALECQNRLRYYDAVVMMDEGRYQDALNEFEDIGDIWDSEDLADECQNNIYYIEADSAFGEERYFDAYYMFLSLGGFMDASERAQECILDTPKASELYRNSDFSSKRVSVTIIGPPEEYDYNTYIKIYSTEGELVSSLFIPVGGKLKIGLPSGTFQFKVGYGSYWFGPVDAFGDFGKYQTLLFNGGEETWTVKSNYSYTLTLITQDGGNIGGRSEDPDDF